MNLQLAWKTVSWRGSKVRRFRGMKKEAAAERIALRISSWFPPELSGSGV
jgi:hypothetical protein